MATTVLFIALGGLIVARTALADGPAQAHLVGIALGAYGIYRALYILRAFRGRRDLQ